MTMPTMMSRLTKSNVKRNASIATPSLFRLFSLAGHHVCHPGGLFHLFAYFLRVVKKFRHSYQIAFSKIHEDTLCKRLEVRALSSTSYERTTLTYTVAGRCLYRRRCCQMREASRYQRS